MQRSFAAKVNRVYIKRYPPTDEDSDYISAVYVDGVRLRNQYLATQLPLPATFCDFWRTVAEYNVELIISLQPPDPQDPVGCQAQKRIRRQILKELITQPSYV